MKLPSSVTITPPSFTRPDGVVRAFQPRTLNSIEITIIDNNSRRFATAAIASFPRPVPLWVGDDYDEAGDYTQAQAEARLLEVLGPDIKAGLEALFVAPAQP